ncbi:MAG: hypothetical protein CM1200mP2_59760 [Planctomycetaceae bacterium]|nr:MAG: hypothetical protein CM1200mP2_59760 [Planctomycetaceae bacterium]
MPTPRGRILDDDNFLTARGGCLNSGLRWGPPERPRRPIRGGFDLIHSTRPCESTYGFQTSSPPVGRINRSQSLVRHNPFFHPLTKNLTYNSSTGSGGHHKGFEREQVSHQRPPAGSGRPAPAFSTSRAHGQSSPTSIHADRVAGGDRRDRDPFCVLLPAVQQAVAAPEPFSAEASSNSSAWRYTITTPSMAFFHPVSFAKRMEPLPPNIWRRSPVSQPLDGLPPAAAAHRSTPPLRTLRFDKTWISSLVDSSDHSMWPLNQTPIPLLICPSVPGWEQRSAGKRFWSSLTLDGRFPD